MTEAARIERLLGQEVLVAAPGLLGWRLATDFGEKTEVMLNEVEAYAGDLDPASHAYRGPTPRNRSMFETAGTLYVYRSYGLHWCMNVVVGDAGVGHAILLRGGIPTVGEEIMARRRGRLDHLADGPGKLTQALGVTGEQDGTSVLSGRVRLIPARLPGDFEVMSTTRVGISKARDRAWRFVAVAATG